MSLSSTALWSALLLISGTVMAAPSPETTVDSALNTCYAEIGDAPRTALASCLNKLRVVAEAQVEKALVDAEDRYRSVKSSASEQAIDELRLSENAFQLYMALECKRVAAAAMGASGAGDIEIACQVDLLRARAASLFAE